jgi:EpsI family protein
MVAPRAPFETLSARIGDFIGTDREISEDERRVGGTSDYLMRVFTDSLGRSFSVYVGYYAQQARGQTIHSPRNCLPGAGWETLTTGVVTTTGNDARAVNRVILAKEGRRAVVYYWYQGRGRVVASEYAVKWNLLRDAALARRTEEALVRIVIMLDQPGMLATGPEIDRADTVATGVANVLIPSLESVLPLPPGRDEVVEIAHHGDSSPAGMRP